MHSEVNFPRFWGVLYIEKWSPFFVSVIGSAVSKILRIARFVRSNGRKTTFEWPKVVSEVSFPSFLGVFRSMKVVSVFCFGDRKCRFQDIAIRAFLRGVTLCVVWHLDLEKCC